MKKLIPFEPAIWARDAHSQTILADLLPSIKMHTPGEKWTIELTDGDRLICRLAEGNSPYIALFAHGLTGDANAGYNTRIGQVLQQAGHTICRMNHRNCGEGFGLARNPYHAGSSDDLARIIYELRRLYPGKKIILIGFSMSGNASLLLSSSVVPGHGVFSSSDFLKCKDQMKWSLPDFTLAINPPVELSRTTDRFLNSFNRFYQWNFVRVFSKLIDDMHKHDLLDQKFETHPLMTIRKFDDMYTAQRCGFGTAENFYRTCGAGQYLKQVQVPTYILTSKDDPIIDFKDLESLEKSSLVRLHVEEKGGHMGFLCRKRTPLGDFRWMDYAVSEIFNELIL